MRCVYPLSELEVIHEEAVIAPENTHAGSGLPKAVWVGFLCDLRLGHRF